VGRGTTFVLGVAVLATALVTSGTVFAGSGVTAVRKQRIAIDMVVNKNGTGTRRTRERWPSLAAVSGPLCATG
jgi:hypothetical protein